MNIICKYPTKNLFHLLSFFLIFIGLNSLSTGYLQTESGLMTLCPSASETGIFLGDNGYIFLLNDFKIDYPVRSFHQDFWERHIETLNRRGVNLVVGIFPPRGYSVQQNLPEVLHEIYDENLFLRYYDDYVSFFEASGALVVPLLDLAHTVKEKGDDLYFRGDHHKTPEFLRAVAEGVSSNIITNYGDVYNSQKETSYLIHEDGSYSFSGSRSRLLKQKCPDLITYEEEAMLIEARAEGEVDMDLFGEIAQPQYILICNSNCERGGNVPPIERDTKVYQSGIPDYFKTYLARDVIGHGVSGSAFPSYESVLYNLLPNYEDGPDFLIFLPETSNISLPYSLLRQLSPAVTGEEGIVLLDREIRITEPETLLIPDSEIENVVGSDYYVALYFSDKNILDFSLEFDHIDQSETLEIQRSSRIHNPGIWYVELPPYIGSELVQITLYLPEEQVVSGSTVQVRLMKNPF